MICQMGLKKMTVLISNLKLIQILIIFAPLKIIWCSSLAAVLSVCSLCSMFLCNRKRCHCWVSMGWIVKSSRNQLFLIIHSAVVSQLWGSTLPSHVEGCDPSFISVQKESFTLWNVWHQIGICVCNTCWVLTAGVTADSRFSASQCQPPLVCLRFV